MLFGLGPVATQGASTACASLTQNVTTWSVASTTTDPVTNSMIGPDVIVTYNDGTPTGSLPVGQSVVVPGTAYDGYLNYLAATIQITRLGTLIDPNAPNVVWPAFKVLVCLDAYASNGFSDLGVSTWGPMMTWNELGTVTLPSPVVFTPGIYAPHALPVGMNWRLASLVAKVMVAGQLPVALNGESTYDFPAAGLSYMNVNNNKLITYAAMAVGNASEVVDPSDPLGRHILAFMTIPGQSIAVSAGAGITPSGTPASLLYPASVASVMGAAPIPFTVSPAELNGTAGQLDTLQGDVLGLGGNFAGQIHLDSGPSTTRESLYSQYSSNPNAQTFLAQRNSALNAAFIPPATRGRMSNQTTAFNTLGGLTSFFVMVTKLSPAAPIRCNVGCAPLTAVGGYCGDFICDTLMGENADNCAHDCGGGAPPPLPPPPDAPPDDPPPDPLP
jgi:hypothetical protein